MVERSFHVGYSTFSTAPFSHAYVNEKKTKTNNDWVTDQRTAQGQIINSIRGKGIYNQGMSLDY